MPLIINTNVDTLRGMSSLRKSSNRLSDTLRHISSGLRVSRASDDAGRLGSITLAESEVRGLKKSIQNLNDGLSLAQTLEGGLGQLELILQRMRELAVQASNDTYNANDRQAIHAEAAQLLKQIDSISEQTNFNKINLLDGSAHSVGIFVDDGIRTSSFDLSLHDVRDTSVGRKAQYESQRQGVHVSDLEDGDVKINGFAVRGTVDTDDTLSHSFGSGSAIAKANAINAISSLTGVRARALANVVTANRQVTAFTLTPTQYFEINGARIGGFGITDFDSAGTLRQAINEHAEETGVVASLNGNAQLQLVAKDGRNIQIRYSHKNVLEAVGLADTTLDPNNLAGDVILGEPDRDLKGTIQALTTTGGFVGGLSQVGGRYDGSEVAKDNYVDFVAQVVNGGGLGFAELRFDRDAGNDVGPAEDFNFILGQVNGVADVSGVSGSFVTTGGTITVGGTYNEALSRTYQLQVIQTGSTDGPDPAKRAVVRVVTAEDGEIIPALTLDAAAGPQNIAVPNLGEFITIDVGASKRSEDFSENNVAQTYSKTLGNGVTISGSYSGDIDKNFTIEVVEEGYTQGANLAKISIFEENLVTGAVTTLATFVDVVAGAEIVIADDLKITFDSEMPTFSDVVEVDGGAPDSYAGNVTIQSAPIDFVGERGDGTYAVVIDQAGPTGQATYKVTFEGVEIVAAQTLNSGIVTLEDGLTLNFDASVSTIGATNVITANGDYQDFAGISIGGDYDGLLNDVTVQVRVKSEGRVLAELEPVTSDAAILEFRLGDGPWQGDIVAVTGTPIALSNGLELTLGDASTISELTDAVGNTVGNQLVFNSGALKNYEGTITFDLDETQLQLSADATIRFQGNNAVVGSVIGGGAGEGSIDIIVTSGGVTTTTTINNPEANTYQVIQGLTVTFANDAARVDDTTNAGPNNDGADITVGAGAYSGVLGNGTLEVAYTGDTSQAIVADNANRVGASLSGTYNGSEDDVEYTLSFTGTDQDINRTGNGGNDGAGSEIGIDGAYTGVAQDKTLTITYVGGSTAVSTPQAGGGGNFTVGINGEYNRSSNNKTLTVEFEGRTEILPTGHTPGGGPLSSATATLSAATYDWDAGSHTVEVEFTGEDAARLKVDGALVGPTLSGATFSFDLGSADYIGLFNNVDPGVDLLVTTDAVLTETGEVISFDFNQLQTVKISDKDDPTKFAENVDISGSVDLGDAAFDAIFGAGNDPGINLTFTAASQSDSPVFEVELTAIRQVNIVDELGNEVNGVDISTGPVNLGDGRFDDIFGAGNDPGVKLTFTDTFAGVDDEYTLELTTNTEVAVTRQINGGAIENLGTADVSGGSYTIAGTGVTVDFDLVDVDKGIDDVVTVNLTMDKTVTVNFNGNPVGGTHDVSDESLDLDAVFGEAVGFDLNVASPVKGRDDVFTFELIRDRSVDNGPIAVAGIEQRTLNANDLIEADLEAGTLESGTRYEVTVDAPTLTVGKEYTIEERVGTLNFGDVIEINTTHAFQAPRIVMNQTTVLSNGLQLEFNAGATFEIGDEIRFQALQYQGDPIASGPYDDPAFPTTFVVEVITSGAVDGAAQLKYTRLDNGDTGNVAASSNATLLQNNVHIAFTAGTLYAGDKFFIETVSDLAQDFGAGILLESDEGIEIELASVTVDNELGRLLYVGDPDLANQSGTFDSLTNAYLGVNSEETLRQVDMTTKESAVDTMRILDRVLAEVTAFRTETGAMQNRIERQLGSLSQALFQTESYVSRIRDADIAFETAELAQQQIIQQAGVQMLSVMNFSPQIALQLLEL